MSDSRKPPPLLDPAALWRDWLGKGEEQSNAWLNRAMGTDAFAAAFGLSTKTALGVQGLVGAMLRRYLEAVHLPSREEVHAIGARLAAIEDQLQRLSDALERSGQPAPRGDRPPKTRKAPDRAVATPPTPPLSSAVVARLVEALPVAEPASAQPSQGVPKAPRKRATKATTPGPRASARRGARP